MDEERRADDSRLAVIISKLEQNEKDHVYLSESTDKLTVVVTDLRKILAGNGRVGLVGQVALFKQSLGKAWWFISIITVMLIGVVGRSLWGLL